MKKVKCARTAAALRDPQLVQGIYLVYSWQAARLDALQSREALAVFMSFGPQHVNYDCQVWQNALLLYRQKTSNISLR